MNNEVTYQEMIEQPIPKQFVDEEAQGGCDTAGIVLALFVVAVLVGFIANNIK